MPSELITNSPQETQEVAKKLISALKTGQVIVLVGDLGAGKTTFVQGIGETLGISRMVSPTYTLIREYPIDHQFFNKLYHLDLYRLSTADEVEALGTSEILSDPHALVLIEWPEKILERLSAGFITISFEQLSDTQRKITIK